MLPSVANIVLALGLAYQPGGGMLLPGASDGGLWRRGAVTEDTVLPADKPQTPLRGFFMGTLPTTADGQDVPEAYAQFAECGDWVPVWGEPTPFWRLAEVLEGDWGATFVETLIRGNGLFPVVHMSFVETWGQPVCPPGLEGCSLAQPEWRAAYSSAALEVIRVARPRFLSLGNEVNRWWELVGEDSADPNGFQHFVSLYEETYDAVKALSPDTVVFVVFSREIVDGLREADLTVLERFDPSRLDLLAFTLYPYAVRTGPYTIRYPEGIPDDYLSRAFEHIPPRPIAITEIGWPEDEFFGGLEGQAEILRQVAWRLTYGQGLQPVLVGWDWLHDLEGGNDTGMIRRDGAAKPVWLQWQEMYHLWARPPRGPASGRVRP